MADAFFDYQLLPELIAQQPAERRDLARLLVLNRAAGSLSHRTIADLPDLLRPGDLLILNDTRVVPARLVGRRQRTGGKWEGLFLHAHADGTWELLSQTRGTLTPGEIIAVESPGAAAPGLGLTLELLEKTPERHWRVRPSAQPAVPAWPLLQAYGQVPLPPYIRKGRASGADPERYQTVYAQTPGAVAAPTAGLHFTPELLGRLAAQGISTAAVTLHVGLGTFQPVQAADYRHHVMHREWGELPAATVAAIGACRSVGGRVVAIGTTSVRVLETVAAAGPLRPWSGETDLFIYPPYPFRAVDVLLTNFHLPRSTLLLLVSAFAGVDLLRTAYTTAMAERYRFYSYGDAMLIV